MWAWEALTRHIFLLNTSPVGQGSCRWGHIWKDMERNAAKSSWIVWKQLWLWKALLTVVLKGVFIKQPVLASIQSQASICVNIDDKNLRLSFLLPCPLSVQLALRTPQSICRLRSLRSRKYSWVWWTLCTNTCCSARIMSFNKFCSRVWVAFMAFTHKTRSHWRT